jgi:hypothetical protein
LIINILYTKKHLFLLLAKKAREARSAPMVRVARGIAAEPAASVAKQVMERIARREHKKKTALFFKKCCFFCVKRLALFQIKN